MTEQVCVTINTGRTGKRIRSLLEKNGFTVRDVQNAMGFESPRAIYKWFSGASLPSIDNLLILSRLLHTEMENILVIDGDVSFLSSFQEKALILFRYCQPGSPRTVPQIILGTLRKVCRLSTRSVNM